MASPGVRDHIPLEQGLRLGNDRTWRSYRRRVRDHIPLEQGLRRELNILNNGINKVRDHIPLEQGLRLILPLSTKVK